MLNARNFWFILEPAKVVFASVRRPFRYVREDFFLGRSFRNLDDLNVQVHEWLDYVANRRVHATTRRVVAEHFAEEQSHLQALPNGPFQAVLRLERRITRDGMVSVNGNLYSVPNATRRRPVEVHSTAREIRIFEQDWLVAVRLVLEGRGQRRIAAGHPSLPPPATSHTPRQPRRPGEMSAAARILLISADGSAIKSQLTAN